MQNGDQLCVQRDSILGRTRNASVFLCQALWLALAVGGLLVLADCWAKLAGLIQNVAVGIYSLGGGPFPEDQRAMVAVAVYAASGALAAGLALVLSLKYRSYWRRKLEESCGSGAPWSRFGVCPPVASPAARSRHDRYLQLAVRFPCWQSLEGLKPFSARGANPELTPEEVLRAKLEILKAIESEVSARALALGLVTGIASNRWIDRLAIIGGALEVQLHVLSRLGRRPSLRMWWKTGQRCLASLFINTYLDKGDALYVRFLIEKTAWSIGLGAHALDQASQQLGEIDTGAVADHIEDVLHVGGGTLGAILFPARVTMSAGAIGLRQLSDFISGAGQELAQGVAAALALYYQGMDLATDILAADQQEKFSEAFQVNFSSAIKSFALEAGKILREQVALRRSAIMRRRKETLKAVAKSVPVIGKMVRKFGRREEAESPPGHPPRQAPSVSEENPPQAVAKRSWYRFWRGWR
jgi:hypothetical protein